MIYLTNYRNRMGSFQIIQQIYADMLMTRFLTNGLEGEASEVFQLKPYLTTSCRII